MTIAANSASPSRPGAPGEAADVADAPDAASAAAGDRRVAAETSGSARGSPVAPVNPAERAAPQRVKEEKEKDEKAKDAKEEKEKEGKKKTYYERRSQYRHWRFSEEQLRDIRLATNAAAVERVKRSFGEENKRRVEEEPTAATVDVSNLQFLTVRDELTLCAFYEAKAMEFCNHFKYPVQAAAVTYIKRFFLHNSAMDYPPKNVMFVSNKRSTFVFRSFSVFFSHASHKNFSEIRCPPGAPQNIRRITCLFLATKTENHFISAEKMAERIPKTSKATVLELEFTISQALRFEYAPHHPYKPLYGLWLDMQRLLAATDAYSPTGPARDPQVRAEACRYVALHRRWPHIAWACMRRACRDHGKGDEFQAFLAARVTEASASSLLSSVMDRIDEPLRSFVKPNIDKVREIDRRLILCRNPEKNPASLMWVVRSLSAFPAVRGYQATRDDHSPNA
ncbi:MAG: hypothetical protein BJ554DRAFT_7873, partial [Olpidium bornovanus]